VGATLSPFDVFILHKKSTGKDFAEHLKAGLEEMGFHSFLDSKDIPKMTDGVEEWISIRDQALEESRNIILIMTPGFDLSSEVKKELRMSRKMGHKNFLYFRQRDMGRKIIVDLGNEIVDIGRQEQVSFENKEELLRLAAGILLREGGPCSSNAQKRSEPSTNRNTDAVQPKVPPSEVARNYPIESNVKTCCEMCSKPIEGQPYVELIDDKPHSFHCKECARTYKKFKSLYGDDFK
jgi:hypothetical protein